MKFAFLILGDFRPETDRAAIHGGAAQMRGAVLIDGMAVDADLPRLLVVEAGENL